MSSFTANKDLRYIKATFNFGKKRDYIDYNPCEGFDFLPINKKTKKFIPTSEEVNAVIAQADPETKDYLLTLRDTMGRMSEINRLSWDDIDFKNRCVTLYTRKKKGGNLTPRTVSMTQKLYEAMSNRFAKRTKLISWVFFHKHWDVKTKQFVLCPFKERTKIMRTLCKKAGVPYFRFHALRHSGASIMENANVFISSIQRILGHENRSTTEIYLHSIGNPERIAIDVFEKLTQQKSHTESHTEQNLGIS